MTLQDGDLLDAATLNGETGAIATEVNNVKPWHLRRHALRREHMPDLLPSDLFPNGFTKMYSAAGVAAQSYDFGQPGAWSTSTVDLQLVSTDAPNPPYGPGTGDGWRVPALANVTADAAEVVFPAFNMDDERIAGIYVRGGINLEECFPVAALSTKFQDCVLVCVGFTDGAGNRHVLEDSILPWGKWAWCYGACGTGYFIQQSDLDDLGDGEIQAYWIGVCSRIAVNDSATSRAFIVGNYWVSGIPLHAGALS